MDPRRHLSLAACGLLLTGCAAWPGASDLPDVAASGALTPAETSFEVDPSSMPASAAISATERPYLEPTAGRPSAPVIEIARTPPPTPAVATTGREAIAAANVEARSASSSDRFVGGVQIFAWEPGRVFEVWTAPLRVTTLTLGVGETIVSKAAGDTVRWQIGDTTSGSGETRRSHVLLKPLERGLETNLVLTTSHRVYLLTLKSGAADAFNAAVAWDNAATVAEVSPAPGVDDRVADPVVTPQGPLDARYRIEPRGRRARWTPTSVFNDGVRTFITFAPDLQVDEAPTLFVVAPDGEHQMVNYRQAGGLFIVDRVFDQAELRLGDRRPQVVRIRRVAGGGL